jgi:hypothetical protein
MSALAPASRDHALERRIDRLERAMAALRRIDEAALRTAPVSSPLTAALGAFARDVAATRRELRRVQRRRAPADLTGGRGV